MTPRRPLIAISSLFLFVVAAHATAQEDRSSTDRVVGHYPGASASGAAPAASPARPALVVPESASTHYGRGNAPFYVRAKSYAARLQRTPEHNYVSNVLATEAAALAITPDEVEALGHELAQIRRRENADRVSALRNECTPLLTGGTMSNEDAMQAIARIDDALERGANIAREVMMEIAERHGEALAARLEARIIESGATIEFSQAHMVKVIAAIRDSDYRGSLEAECKAL